MLGDQLLEPAAVEDPHRVGGHQQVLGGLRVERVGAVEDRPGDRGAGNAVAGGDVARVDRPPVDDDPVPAATSTGCVRHVGGEGKVIADPQQPRARQIAQEASGPAGVDGSQVELVAGEGRAVEGVDATMDEEDPSAVDPAGDRAGSEPDLNQLPGSDQLLLPGGDDLNRSLATAAIGPVLRLRRNSRPIVRHTSSLPPNDSRVATLSPPFGDESATNHERAPRQAKPRLSASPAPGRSCPRSGPAPGRRERRRRG